jgi:hypothetical protein
LKKLHLPSLEMAVETLLRISHENAATDKQVASAKAKVEARKRFEAVFPLLMEEVTSYLNSINLPDNAVEWFMTVSISPARELNEK